MRFMVSMLAGVVVALLLFLLMNSLIGSRGDFDADQGSTRIIDIVRVKQDELTQKKRRPPKEPPPPKKPPPPPKLTTASNEKPPPQQLNINIPNIDLAVSTGDGPYLGGWNPSDPGQDGDVIPIVRIEPQYPRQALLDGIEGYVRFEFTITEDGSVANPKVIDAEPNRIFNREATRAILRWKFKPRVVDGKPVRRQAQQTIEFKMGG